MSMSRIQQALIFPIQLKYMICVRQPLELCGMAIILLAPACCQ
jgi:hypothetical protein